jgi:hypothetical protein
VQLQQFFSLLATSGAPEASYDALFAALMAAGMEEHAASKQCQQSAALCLGVLTAAVGGAKPAEAARKLLVGAGGSAAAQRLALLALGEVGRRADLGAVPEVEALVLSALSAESEGVSAAGGWRPRVAAAGAGGWVEGLLGGCSAGCPATCVAVLLGVHPWSPHPTPAPCRAASVALGGVTCGALPRYLPSLLQRIAAAAAAPKQQYLLLQALAEVVSTAAEPGASLQLGAPDVASILQLLLDSAQAEEECRWAPRCRCWGGRSASPADCSSGGLYCLPCPAHLLTATRPPARRRSVVATCLGGLALVAPDTVLPAMAQQLPSPSADMRAVVVSALKATVQEGSGAADAQLQVRAGCPWLPQGWCMAAARRPRVARPPCSVSAAPAATASRPASSHHVPSHHPLPPPPCHLPTTHPPTPQACLLDFLLLMGDADRHVRKAAVVTLAAVLHQRPALVVRRPAPLPLPPCWRCSGAARPAMLSGCGAPAEPWPLRAQVGSLPRLLPLLYEQTVVRPELIRTVDLGPFKHRIDDGLELRKVRGGGGWRGAGPGAWAGVWQLAGGAAWPPGCPAGAAWPCLVEFELELGAEGGGRRAEGAPLGCCCGQGTCRVAEAGAPPLTLTPRPRCPGCLQAAFECMDVLLDAAGSALDQPQFIQHLVEGARTCTRWAAPAGLCLLALPLHLLGCACWRLPA